MNGVSATSRGISTQVNGLVDRSGDGTKLDGIGNTTGTNINGCAGTALESQAGSPGGITNTNAAGIS